MPKGKTIHTKIRNLENSITRDLNPALEKADRTRAPRDLEDALSKIENVLLLARRIRLHVRRELNAVSGLPTHPVS